MKLLQIHEPGETPLPHQDEVAVGIDLGTTHSVVALASENGAETIHNIHGHALVPSVVHYAPDGSVEVGYPAKKLADEGNIQTISSVKRRMHDAGAQFEIGNRTVTPVEVSAEILKKLKKNAERALGKTVSKAVITVPAYFDDAARVATKDAARLAGLEVLRLINEPTAAALAYGLDKGLEGVYAIYDLGGGTFDVSILKLEQGVFQVLATAGDTQLGGDDIDALIPQAEGIPRRVIKERLSTELEVAGITRATLEALATPLVQKTLDICARAFADAKLSKADVKGIVLVGGSTRMPLVQRMVAEWFGRPPLTDLNPDEVVALGAAIQAHGLTFGSDNLLLDVVPLSLGLETVGGITEKLIERNTPIPVAVTQEFTTYQDHQTGMQFLVVQGEREMVKDNRELARFELTGIPSLPAGIARIKVTFAVDADGLLTVSAEENTTGASQSVHVKPSYGLQEGDMERMLMESMQHARQDMTLRLITEAKVEAGRALAELESALSTDGGLLTEAERSRLERQMQVVKNTMEGEDRDYIEAEVQQLGQLAQPFAEKRMDKAISGALKGMAINTVAENQ